MGVEVAAIGKALTPEMFSNPESFNTTPGFQFPHKQAATALTDAAAFDPLSAFNNIVMCSVFWVTRHGEFHLQRIRYQIF